VKTYEIEAKIIRLCRQLEIARQVTSGLEHEIDELQGQYRIACKERAEKLEKAKVSDTVPGPSV